MISGRRVSILAVLALSGCVSGPNAKPPEMALPAKFSESAASPGAIQSQTWWHAFNDPQMNGLVERGLTQNLSVMEALEAITVAHEGITSASAGSLPKLTVGGSNVLTGSEGRFKDTVDRNETGAEVNVSWLLDFFGLYRRAKEGAVAELDAAYAGADVARLAMVSELLTAYVDARYYQERIRVTRQDLLSRRKTLGLTQQKLDLGATSKLDVAQADGLVKSVASELPGLEANFLKQCHRMSTLIGVPADTLVAELTKDTGQPIAGDIVKIGIPADLVRNRPDIRRKERELAAEVAKIGVAEAQLYPAIKLGGNISPSYLLVGGSKGGLSNWSFGPSLTLPIFDGGVLRANVNVAESNARTQYIRWKATVLRAVEEVENGLTGYNRDKVTVTGLTDVVSSYRNALVLATASYKGGEASILDVLDAQRSVSNAQANLASANRQSAIDYIALNVAIGGGYSGQDNALPAPLPAPKT